MISPIKWMLTVVGFALLSPSAVGADDEPKPLQDQLASEPLADLARAARERGDAARGAALFFQPFLACARCHDGADGSRLGPDLSRLGPESTAETLVESVLAPSKVIRKGYEPIVIAAADGRTVTGILVADEGGKVVILDPAAGGGRVEIAADAIEARAVGTQSLMPDGLANLLSDRQQFLDLAKYLIAIQEGGPARAAELRPTQTALVVPEYEREIDHAGMIGALDEDARKRGEAIYVRACANCHGTEAGPGSMPTSRRFASDTFKNGSAPYSLYRTLTHGYGQMAPQTWMVPRQKYDVIHYLRETYLKTSNPSQFAKVDATYLAELPKGTSRGPDPVVLEPWATMDYGPSLMNTYEVGEPGPNIAYKGIAVRLDPGPGGVSRGSRWALFDHDTMRLAAAWTGAGFIDWKGIHFNGEHQIHPHIVGEVQVANPPGPGWADPETGRFDDPRMTGRDGRHYGPLPRPWAKFKGLYAFGDQSIVSYSVGSADVLEAFGAEIDPEHPESVVFTRTLEIGPSPKELLAQLAPSGVAVALVGDSRAELVSADGFSLLRVPASDASTLVKVLMAKRDSLDGFAKSSPAPRSLRPFTVGGPRRWPETLATDVLMGTNDGPFAVDTFGLPDPNPWNAQVRMTGFDFAPDGRSAFACAWDGDVWRVSGFDQPEHRLTWQRIASGLFQPLGLKVRDGEVFVTCRDQLVRLRDLNGDGETDFYECFNDDHQVTEHFHEFAMGLQADAEGNFYYAKSGRHALPALVPQHGTLLKVSRDGARTEILATGFRAANGVCLNPDGTFFVTDQEGFWTPKNRINLVEKGGFYGNMWGYTDVTDTSDAAMKQPLCWITNEFDRSPAELLWVTSDRWGPLKGSLLNLSYGSGKIFVVPHEVVNGQAQGGMCALPIPPLPTGVMRGRFHPTDGQLYACGMYAWAGNRTEPGGLYRVRYTGKPADLPVGLKAKGNGIEVTFTNPIDPASARDAHNYEIQAWGLLRSKNYGSDHIDEHSVQTRRSSLLRDGKTVRIELADPEPTRGMEIKYRLKGTDGRAIAGTIHNTIHAFAQDRPTGHDEREVEGWTVRVDERLLAAPREALGERSLRFLRSKLSDVKAILPEDKVRWLQRVPIVLDLNHGDLGPMEYHPSARWLAEHGYSEDLAKCVHIARAEELVTRRDIVEQPWAILHELAHAYHDQVLGFEDPAIRQAFEEFRQSGRGERTLRHDGQFARHYALTDPMEFFAEMTESYFGSNDFFPFNRAELGEAEPGIVALLRGVWGAPIPAATR